VANHFDRVNFDSHPNGAGLERGSGDNQVNILVNFNFRTVSI
jgi:hypothetical protein